MNKKLLAIMLLGGVVSAYAGTNNIKVDNNQVFNKPVCAQIPVGPVVKGGHRSLQYTCKSLIDGNRLMVTKFMTNKEFGVPGDTKKVRLATVSSNNIVGTGKLYCDNAEYTGDEDGAFKVEFDDCHNSISDNKDIDITFKDTADRPERPFAEGEATRTSSLHSKAASVTITKLSPAKIKRASLLIENDNGDIAEYVRKN